MKKFGVKQFILGLLIFIFSFCDLSYLKKKFKTILIHFNNFISRKVKKR
jgi:hypothetical protein